MVYSGSRFRDPRVWVESVSLAKEIYRITADFPAGERFGLTSQLRRAAVSVASNIAEGSVRRSRKEFCHYLETALGSLAEIETQFEIAADIHPAALPSTISEQIRQIRRMLYKLIASLLPPSKSSAQVFS